MTLGTMLEQPLPRKINADSGEVPSTKPLEVAMPSSDSKRRKGIFRWVAVWCVLWEEDSDGVSYL